MGIFSDTMAITAGGMRAQATRLQHISENLANADTPGYRRKTVSFETEFDAQTGAAKTVVGPVALDRSELEKIYDPGHPLADLDGHYQGSNVNMMVEVADAREAHRSYEANLKLFDQIRQMSRGLLDLLRR